MMSAMKGKLDLLLEKAISRKLLVWVTATGLMLTANLESADWVIISGLYLGGQGIIDAIAKLKGA
jgi:predicted Rossmann fold nucleotide-binding protein DprA/Smf involved in DNA uptake